MNDAYLKEDCRMEETKPWYLSRTIWASAVVVAATLAGAFGYAVEEAEADGLADAILEAVAAFAAVVAIVGRIAARSRIG